MFKVINKDEEILFVGSFDDCCSYILEHQDLDLEVIAD